MKVLIDSNVLIAALLESHEFHGSSKAIFERALKSEYELYMSAHGIAESYCQLTAMPHQRITPSVAVTTLTHAMNSLSIMALDADDYAKTLRRAEASSVMGGGFYDLLHVQAAANSGVESIATWNKKHFDRLCKDEAFGVVTPDELSEKN
jgi:predicted nucleic acid-binding protein